MTLKQWTFNLKKIKSTLGWYRHGHAVPWGLSEYFAIHAEHHKKKVRNLGILRNIPKEPSLCRPAESTLVTFFVSGFSRNHYLSDKFKHLKERSNIKILVLLYGIDKFVYSKFMYGHKWKVVYHFLSCRLRYEPKT